MSNTPKIDLKERNRSKIVGKPSLCSEESIPITVKEGGHLKKGIEGERSSSRNGHKKPSPARNRRGAYNSPGRKRNTSSPAKNRRFAQSPCRSRNTQIGFNQSKLTNDQLEAKLQEFLKSRKFMDAAKWIHASEFLSRKYVIADVVRVVLDAKKYDLASKMIREFELKENQLLVTLYIKELIRSGQFHLAVRSAKEFVINFGKKVSEHDNTLQRPSWTPQTLIQAMIRADQYKPALIYADEFGLLESFPPTQLILQLSNKKSWYDAFRFAKDYHLESHFPLVNFINQMLNDMQWHNALKCIQTGGTIISQTFPMEVVVRKMCEAGHFVIAIETARKFSLVAQEKDLHNPLRSKEFTIARSIVTSMLDFKEYYKGIKYAIKFGLSEEDEFQPTHLIKRAISDHQFHVALFYMRKLNLIDPFLQDLPYIYSARKKLMKEFLLLRKIQIDRIQSPSYRSALSDIIGVQPLDLQEELEEEVLYEHEEIIPRNKNTTDSYNVEDDEKIVLPSRVRKSDSNKLSAASTSRSENSENLFNFEAFAAQVQGTQSACDSSLCHSTHSHISELISDANTESNHINFNNSNGKQSTPLNTFDVASLAMQFHQPRASPYQYYYHPSPTVQPNSNYGYSAPYGQGISVPRTNQTEQSIPQVPAPAKFLSVEELERNLGK